jgi:hypothetical protein
MIIKNIRPKDMFNLYQPSFTKTSEFSKDSTKKQEVREIVIILSSGLTDFRSLDNNFLTYNIIKLTYSSTYRYFFEYTRYSEDKYIFFSSSLKVFHEGRRSKSLRIMKDIPLN